MKDFAYVILAIIAALAFGLAAALTLGCSTTQTRPACGPEALAQIEADYVAEIVWTCDGLTYEACQESPEGREVEARFDAIRKEWIECR